MIFSLFGKKSRKDSGAGAERKDRGGETDKRPRTALERGDSIFDTHAPGGSRHATTLAETRRKQAEMTAKIDAIESEMVGEFPTITRASSPRKATPVPKGVDLPPEVRRAPDSGFKPVAERDAAANTDSPPTLPPLEMTTDILFGATGGMGAVEIRESAPSTNPAAEEAAIFFANGQRKECERALHEAIALDADNREAWLLLFELHQQAGDFRAFESLAVEYSVKFETSPPAWRDARPVVHTSSARAPASEAPTVVLPAMLDAMSVKEIDQAKQQLRHASRVRLNLETVTGADEVGVKLLLDLFRSVRATTQEITLSGAEQAAHALRSRFVVGDPHQSDALWLLVLELYRLLEWEKQFEDLSVEYSVTFEVSPPQYEKPPANFVIGSALPRISLAADGGREEKSAQPALIGEVTGRAAEALVLLDGAAGVADRIEIDCSQLGRVDFAAAGALLNWLLGAQAHGKQFVFNDVNVLVAALFAVMGVDGVARVQRRKT